MYCLLLSWFVACALGEKSTGIISLPSPFKDLLPSYKLKVDPQVTTQDLPATALSSKHVYSFLGSSLCGISGIRNVASIKPQEKWRAMQCRNLQADEADEELQVQAVVLNPLGSHFSLHFQHGIGTICPEKTNADSFTDSLTVASDVRAVLHTSTCGYNQTCCVSLQCEHYLGNCEGLKMSLAFVAPVPPAKCNVTNFALPYIPSGSVSRAVGCQLPGTVIAIDITRNFTLANPNGHELLVWMTDGNGPHGCGLPATRPAGSVSYTYNDRIRSKSTSIAFTGVPCASSQCCAIIRCTSDNAFGCWGMTYSHSIRYKLTSEDALASARRKLAVTLEEKGIVESELEDTKAQAKKAQKSAEDKLASAERKLAVALQEKAGLQTELMDAKAQEKALESKLAHANDTASALVQSLRAEISVVEEALSASIPSTSVGFFSLATLKLVAGVLLIDALFIPIGYWLVKQCKKQKAE